MSSRALCRVAGLLQVRWEQIASRRQKPFVANNYKYYPAKSSSLRSVCYLSLFLTQKHHRRLPPCHRYHGTSRSLYVYALLTKLKCSQVELTSQQGGRVT